MSDWLKIWHSLYEQTEKNWFHMSQKEKTTYIDYLEEMAGSLLDEWTEMDEKIALLQSEKQDFEKLLPYESIGTVYYQLEMFDRAIEAFEIEQAFGIQEEMRQLYLGYSFLFSEQLTKAKEVFLYAIQFCNDPYLKHFAYIGLGCAHVRNDRVEEAIVAFDCANELLTTHDVVYNLGICYFYTKAYHIAADYFMSYLNQVPDDGEALLFLGCCQWEKGLKDDAWTSWTTGIHLLDSAEALVNFAYVLEWHGHHYAAIHCYKCVEMKHIQKVETLHGLAWNYALINEQEQALRSFREALRLDPSNSSIQQSLLWLGDKQPEYMELV